MVRCRFYLRFYSGCPEDGFAKTPKHVAGYSKQGGLFTNKVVLAKRKRIQIRPCSRIVWYSF